MKAKLLSFKQKKEELLIRNRTWSEYIPDMIGNSKFPNIPRAILKEHLSKQHFRDRLQ